MAGSRRRDAAFCRTDASRVFSTCVDLARCQQPTRRAAERSARSSCRDHIQAAVDQELSRLIAGAGPSIDLTGVAPTRWPHSRFFSWPFFSWPPPKSYPWAATVLVDELDAGGFKRPPQYCKRRLTRFRSITFKLTNGGHPDPGSVCEFLLSPVKQAPGRSALRSRDHHYRSGPKPLIRVNTIVFQLTLFQLFLYCINDFQSRARGTYG